MPESIIAALAAVQYIFLGNKRGFEIKVLEPDSGCSLRRMNIAKRSLCDGNKRWVSWLAVRCLYRCTTSPYRGAFAWYGFYRCHNSIAWQATPYSVSVVAFFFAALLQDLKQCIEPWGYL